MSFRRFTRAAICAWLLTSGLFSACQTSAPPASAGQDDAIVRDFETRVAQYTQFRKKEAGKPPKPTTSSEKLEEHRDQMAKSVRTVRAGAKQGDVFTGPIAQYFRRQIAATLHGEQGAKVRASLRRAEPLRGIQLRVNDQYPDGLPLQSTPPTLLLNLPPLPKELQYRIVGQDLVLLDTAPNVIVDFIPNVLPQS